MALLYGVSLAILGTATISLAKSVLPNVLFGTLISLKLVTSQIWNPILLYNMRLYTLYSTAFTLET